ncbi:hypothetical protein FZEAL_3105 [Fusarium zealandicum]|uniref:Uncharacterized protein n=1 Tax=Fusarium zealandicum TaxID=1053134 RepID=A0A8H4XM44_9HYPO|nr:hypothetical protein FZEAL_3105 [Fusarium zealandicum]
MSDHLHPSCDQDEPTEHDPVGSDYPQDPLELLSMESIGEDVNYWIHDDPTVPEWYTDAAPYSMPQSLADYPLLEEPFHSDFVPEMDPHLLDPNITFSDLADLPSAASQVQPALSPTSGIQDALGAL